MSWVLILTADDKSRPSVVIGGFLERSEAEAAGDSALVFDEKSNLLPEFRTYTVIPGAACSGPIGGTHCKVWFEEEYLSGGPKWTCERFYSRS